MSNMKCFFCEVVNGQRKKHINDLPIISLYQDKDIFAMLSMYKGSEKGFDILIFPKKHFEFFDEVPLSILNKLITVTSLFCKRVRNRYQGYHVLQNSGKASGQEIPHAHFHVIPRYENDGISFKRKRNELNLNELINKSEDIKKDFNEFTDIQLLKGKIDGSKMS